MAVQLGRQRSEVWDVAVLLRLGDRLFGDRLPTATLADRMFGFHPVYISTFELVPGGV